MTNQKMIEQFEARAAAERESGSTIEINERLPYVAVKYSNDDEYFFQGEEAENLINEAEAAFDGGINAEDYILAIGQSW